MLAMARPKSLDGCNGLPSVTEAFAKGCPSSAGMTGLTRADAAYLTALYKTNLQARKAVQTADIADRMADLLSKTEGSPRLAFQSEGATRAERR